MKPTLWLAVLLTLPVALPAADWQTYLAAGVQLFQRGDYARASEYLTQARRAAPAPQAEVALWLGRSYCQLGRMREAIEELIAACALIPHDGQAHLWLGYAYAVDRRSAAAVRCFQQALRLLPEGPVKESAVRWLERLHEPVWLSRHEPPAQLITRHFLIKHYPEDLTAPALGTALEEIHRATQTQLGIMKGTPTEVLVFRNLEEYRLFHQQRGTPRPAWSVASSANGRILTYQRPLHLMRETVAHEYTHVAVQLAAGERLPPCWLDEGLASLVAGQYGDLLPVLRTAYGGGVLLNAQELQAESFGNLSPSRAAIAYAQSRSMTEWFLRRFGKQALLHVLLEIARDQSPDQAFRAACGLQQDQLVWCWTQEVLAGGA